MELALQYLLNKTVVALGADLKDVRAFAWVPTKKSAQNR